MKIAKCTILADCEIEKCVKRQIKILELFPQRQGILFNE